MGTLIPAGRDAPLKLAQALQDGKHVAMLVDQYLTNGVDVSRVSETLAEGFYRVNARYGFMEKPDVQDIIAICRERGMKLDVDDTTYYLGRTELLPTGPVPMMRWRKRLFAFMARNASSTTDFFNIPPNRVVELGARLEF